jgi:hypothetical protein
MQKFMIRLLGHRTGVDHDNIRVSRLFRDPVATFKKNILDHLGFIDVHLAPECMDEEFCHK